MLSNIELNYKEGYLFLFNKLTDIMNEIIEIQKQVEEIAISENQSEAE